VAFQQRQQTGQGRFDNRLGRTDHMQAAHMRSRTWADAVTRASPVAPNALAAISPAMEIWSGW
jgi:hypothetical protein